MIGHSTVLIEIGGLKVLTDPYFGVRGNPAYGRPVPPARTREELAAVDGVLVSHGHWDHTDARFLGSLPADVPVVTSKWTKRLVQWQGAKRVVGLGTWEETRVGELAVTAVPALHVIVAVGFIIRGEGRCIYFAGDTYHRPFMKELGRRFAIDIALMPVTTYGIPMTMGERGAVQAVRDLRPSVVVPIHEGLRPRSPLLRTGQTPERFRGRLEEAGERADVVILKEGESWTG